ncbi:OsmC family protein [Nitratireductor pacificus]|nr:OsmC family protein [Nitratireductor pacificus]
MATERHANVTWKGSLVEGAGSLDTQSGALKGLPLGFKARFKDESGTSGTNPEELIAGAHAGCFAMQLSHMLAEGGTPAEKLDVRADVSLQPAEGGGFEIVKSALTLVGKVPGLAEDKFLEVANKAKASCPVSKALGAIEITLDARYG